MNVESRNS